MSSSNLAAFIFFMATLVVTLLMSRYYWTRPLKNDYTDNYPKVIGTVFGAFCLISLFGVVYNFCRLSGMAP